MVVAPAMNHLIVAGRANVQYDLAKGIAVLRKLMIGLTLFFLSNTFIPLGLLQNMASFFISSDSRNVCFCVVSLACLFF